MHTAILKRLNDTVVVEVPADLLEQIHAAPGQSVTLRADGPGFALALKEKPLFAMRDMLARCDFSIPMTDEEVEWTTSPAVGRELL